MRKILLLILILSITANAETLLLTSETAYAGDTITVNLVLENNQTIYGLSLKITETPSSQITFVNATPTSRLNNGLNGAVENNQDKITLYSVFSSNATGITPGSASIYTIQYNIPETTPAGTYQLQPSELTISDQNGQPINATITGGNITVQAAPLRQLVLPDINLAVGEEKNANICLTNKHPTKPIQSVQFEITYDANIIEIIQAPGTATLQTGKTEINLTGLNIVNTDCDIGTGNIGTLKLKGKTPGTTPLTFQDYNITSPTYYSTQALSANNGQASVSGTSSSSSSSGSGSGGGGSSALVCPTYCKEPQYSGVEICKSSVCKKTTPPPTQTPTYTPQEIPFSNKPINEEPTIVEETKQEQIPEPAPQPTSQPAPQPEIQLAQPITEEGIPIWVLVLLIIFLAGFAAYLLFYGKKKPPIQKQEKLPEPEKPQEDSEHIKIIEEKLAKAKKNS